MTPEPQESWLHEVLSGASRWLNAILGGDGAVTLSARAWADHLDGRRTWPVRLLDFLNRDPGHCARAHAWHATPRVLVRIP